MNKIIALLFVLGAATVLSGIAYAEITSLPTTTTEKDCAHGRNNFDCNPPTLRTDIEALEKRVTELEKRVFSP